MKLKGSSANASDYSAQRTKTFVAMAQGYALQSYIIVERMRKGDQSYFVIRRVSSSPSDYVKR